MKKLMAFGVLLTFLSAPAAFAKVSVSIFGAGNYGLLKETQTQNGITGEFAGDLGYGGGLGFGLPLGRTVDFELGGIYLSKKFTSKTDAGTVEVEGFTIPVEATSSSSNVKSLHIPGMFRFFLGRTVSLGVGGFYELLLEDNATSDDADYGATGSLRFSFPMGKSAFFIDGRYTMGLKDHAGNKSKDVLGLVGITF